MPALGVGPYVKQGYVSSVQYDHTSALRHLQNTFGLDPLTARVDAANDLTDCLDLERLARGEWAKPAELPMLDASEWPIESASCRGGDGFPGLAPSGGGHDDDDETILGWADRHPERFAGGYDLRGDHDVYLRSIRAFLRSQGQSR